MVRRQICIQLTSNWVLGLPDLESHWFAERLAYLGRSLSGDAMWRREASRTFPRLQSDPKAESRCRSMGEAPFVRECRKALRNLPGSSDLSQSRKELYRTLLMSSTAGQRRRSAPIGIGRQVRASCISLLPLLRFPILFRFWQTVCWCSCTRISWFFSCDLVSLYPPLDFLSDSVTSSLLQMVIAHLPGRFLFGFSP